VAISNFQHRNKASVNNELACNGYLSVVELISVYSVNYPLKQSMTVVAIECN